VGLGAAVVAGECRWWRGGAVRSVKADVVGVDPLAAVESLEEHGLVEAAERGGVRCPRGPEDMRIRKLPGFIWSLDEKCFGGAIKTHFSSFEALQLSC
jgi:hypothetical protein